jgi:uncharacterized spore protein YtfJ
MPDENRIRAELSRDTEALDFMQRLGERVGLISRAAAIFGDPVEREGVTVIPVAKATWGFGGGSGGEAANQGSGGGGGGVVRPIGFIEVKNGDARFVRTRDLRQTALVVGATAGLVGLLTRRRSA